MLFLIKIYMIFMSKKILNLFRYSFAKNKVNKKFNFSFVFKALTINDLEEILFALDNKYVGHTILDVQNKTKNTEKLTEEKEIIKTFGPSIMNVIGEAPLYKIPLSQKKRLYGIYENFCFYIIAYDPNHKAR